MYNYPLSVILSFIGLAVVVVAYFINNKSVYLFLQASCMLLMVLSYLFICEYFAMISLAVALSRTVTYFLYEKHDKRAPIWLTFLFCGLTLAVYFVVNLGILKTAKPIDIVCLATQCLYTIVFRIRNLKTVRYLVCAPTVLGVIYNVAIEAPIFSVLIYAFEFAANIVAILKFQTIPYLYAYWKKKHLHDEGQNTPNKTEQN